MYSYTNTMLRFSQMSFTDTTTPGRIGALLSVRQSLGLRSIYHISRCTSQPHVFNVRSLQRQGYLAGGGKKAFSNKPDPPKYQRMIKVQKRTDQELSQISRQSSGSTFWERFLGPKLMPERHTGAWYREVALICTVFGITGSSTMVLVRPAVKDVLGIQGSMKDGPWSYRICSLVIMSPIYACLLVVVGTLFGRHFYFKHFAIKIFSRFGIPPEMLDKNFHATKKNFVKW